MNKELLKYFNNDELAANVWLSKYAQKGEETPDDMHKRMAKEFARVEEEYNKQEHENYYTSYPNCSEYGQTRKHLNEEFIYNLFKDFKYIIPQGSIMSQLGANSIGSLSNCFVVGQPEDSYGGIFQKDEEMAQLMKRRGGVGIDISTLRPEGADTTNAAKTSTGAVSFMHRFSNTTREVAQNGRRGALMISMDINHPDVMEFIKIKRDLSQVTGANISIKLDDEFMKAVENDEDYILRFPCDLTLDSNVGKILAESNYDELYSWTDNKHIKKIRAKEYWDEIIKSAHNVAEPGLMFWDNMVNYSPDGIYDQFRQVTTNPCSEIAMQEYDACRLIAVNLFSFVDKPFTDSANFDIKKFYKINYEAMRLSDDLIDLEIEHINRIINKILNDPENIAVKDKELSMWNKILDTAKCSRRTGLGFTALGDTLAALGLKYDSDEALKLIESIMHTKMKSELDCTTDLAILRGTFKGWNKDKEFILTPDDEHEVTIMEGTNIFYEFICDKFPEQANKIIKFGRRNVSWSTVAPTGTVSLMCQTTSGIEPLFQPFYMRRKKINPTDEGVRVDFTDQNGDTWQEFPVLHPKFKEWVNNHTAKGSYYKNNNKDLNKDDLKSLFESSPWYNSTANDIDWIKRVEIQSIIQKYITHSISSTINLPNNVSEEEVSKIYMESWKQGLKGITVYRDGSRSGVLVSNKETENTFEYKDAPKRPKKLQGEAFKSISSQVPFTVIVGFFDEKPYEIFIQPELNITGKGEIVKTKKGFYDFIQKNNVYNLENITDETAAITRLVSVSLRHGSDIKFIVEQLNKIDGDMFGFTKSLGRVLKKLIPDGTKSTVNCNECGSDQVIFQEGCQTCQSCGNSKCG